MKRKPHANDVVIKSEQSQEWKLAQANIGWLRAPLDDPEMAQFSKNLTRINQLGWNHPGFWQHLFEGDGSARFHVFADPNILMNLTVWDSIEALHTFAYRSEHVEFIKQRRDWFKPMEGPTMVLWWIPIGHEPTPEEAKDRLALLADRGPTPLAFTFVKQFTVKEMLAYLE